MTSHIPPRLLLTAMTVMILILAGCVTTSQGTDEPYIVLGDPDTSGLSGWTGNMNSAIVTHDFDGDGVEEVILHSLDRNVYVFNSENGRALAKIPTSYPPAWYVQQILNPVGVGVLEPDEPPSIVIANHASYVSAWTFAPDKSSKDRFVFEERWETRTTKCHKSPGNDAAPVLADLTGDEKLEILVQTEEVGLYALRSDGSTLWAQCWGGGNGSPVAADLDGDGGLEAIFASDAGLLSVFDGATGNVEWTFNARDHGVKPASVPVAPAVADLDGDGLKEILFVARHAPEDDPERFEEFSMGIFAVHGKNGNAELLWMRQPDWAHPMSYTRLVVLDADEDGDMDIFGMDWNTIGHRPGDWEHLGPAHAFRLTAAGEDVWVRDVESWWSNRDIAIADINGDGEMTVLVNGIRNGVDGVWQLSMEKGAARGFVGAEGWKVQGGPFVADLNGNGSSQLLYRVTPEDGDAKKGAVLIFDLQVPLDAPWPGYG